MSDMEGTNCLFSFPKPADKERGGMAIAELALDNCSAGRERDKDRN